MSDRLAGNAGLGMDNWSGADLANWIAGSTLNDRYARNANDGLDRITRANDAGFTYSLPANATELRFEADFRINSKFATNDDPISGIDAGKVVGRVQDVGGSKVLTLTLPVRGSGIPFSGATEQVSDPVDGIVYRLQGSPDLSDWNSTVISEIVPALDAGLPALGSGWEYRTFRTAGDTGTDPRDFIRAVIESAP